ncbi:MAG: SDR family NAD(P)-dependent oxidoreductase [Candidatus Omnitrophota bacterium]
MSGILHQKKIVITGASGSLGRCFAQKAVCEGADVILTYGRHPENLPSLLKEKALGFPMELTDMASLRAFASEVRSRWDDLDVLIHNAAAIRDRTVQNMTETEWDEVLTADLKAPFLLSQELLPLMLGKKGSEEAKKTRKIFFLTSRMAFHGGFGAANYAAAKAGLIGLAKSMAKELGKRRILVNLINPGFMRSAMTEGIPEAALRQNLDRNPLGNYSDPAEVADFLVYLCSDKMTQGTGQIFHFEGREI